MNKNGSFRLTLEQVINRVKARAALKGSVVVVLLLLTAACAAPQNNRPGGPPRDNLAPDIARPDGSVGLSTDNSEVAELWAAAERARSENQPNVALELLYEAMQVDPQNSLLWSRAAELKLDDIEPALAEEYAVRSNSLAGENRPLLHRNWLIIEHARSMRGDLLGVRSAHKQVEVFENR